MIMNRIYAVDCFPPGRAKDLSAPLYILLTFLRHPADGHEYSRNILVIINM